MAELPDVILAGDLELRRCRTEFLDALMSAIRLSQPELARWLPWADPMPTVEAELEFLRGREAAFDADKDWGFSIFERATGELVGGAGLHPKDPGVAEIGYWVRTDRTRRGYATAAARSLTDAAFTCLPAVRRVVIRMDQANTASAAIPPKLEFSLEGEETLRDIRSLAETRQGWVWATTRRRRTS